jgi:hypothetical protein
MTRIDVDLNSPAAPAGVTHLVGPPRDSLLAELGHKFYEAISGSDRKEALEVLNLIEDRVEMLIIENKKLVRRRTRRRSARQAAPPKFPTASSGE